MSATGAIRAGRAFIELTLENKIGKPLKAASAQLRAFAGGAAAAGAGMIGAGSAILAPLLATTVAFAKQGDAIAKMRDRTGVAAESLSELAYAAGQSGTETGTLERGFIGMARSLNDLEQGTQTAKDSFGELGLTLDDLKGLNPEDQFKLIADRLSQIQDPTKRAAIAMEVFGKSGQRLLPLINGGAAGIEKLQQTARDLGLTMSNEAADAAAEYTDRLDDMKQMANVAVLTIGGTLAPAITKMLKVLIPLTAKTLAWGKENRKVILTVAAIAAAVVGVGGVLLTIAAGAMALSFVLSGLASAASIVGAVVGTVLTGIGGALAFLVSPLGLVIAGVAAATAAWLYFSGTGGKVIGWLRETIGGLLTEAKKVIGGITAALMAGDLELAGQIAMATLRMVFLRGMDALSQLFGGMWGDTLGTMASQIASGDLSGAWETAVMAMATLWDSFTEGIVTAFVNAANVVVDTWQRATGAISDAIIESAARGGWGQILLAGTGVDMAAEKDQAERMEPERIAILKKTLPDAIASVEQELATLEAAGDDGAIQAKRDELAALEQQMAELPDAIVTVRQELETIDSGDLPEQVVTVRQELETAEARGDNDAIAAKRDELAQLEQQMAAIEDKQAELAALEQQMAELPDAIVTVRQELETAEQPRDDAAIEARRRQLEQLRKELAEVNGATGEVDFIGDAQAIAREQTGGTADRLRKTLDGMADRARDATDQSTAALKDRVAGGADEVGDRAREAQRELDELLARAKELANADPTEATEQTVPTAADVEASLPTITASQGTFSGFTTQALGSMAGRKDKTEDNTERTADGMEELLDLAKGGRLAMTVEA